eukprot:TRINITY_DN852_c0_g1_i1.p1 TRINITY_DN852_c0_g1~~TRINITY_DN852_c0_g1_i1.p1  ORF type:complete len:153 (+),score=33.19 TRINITY_DN852_c0_g1_i1:59-517(+)
MKKITIGSDHGAFDMKDEIVKYIQTKYAGKVEVVDVGVHSKESVDYPDIALEVCKPIIAKEADAGIALCGSGIGISIACNKVPGIRCALCHDEYTARYCRLHNNANVLSFGGRTTGPEIAKQMVDSFLNTDFEGGRHCGRVDKIHKIESGSC